MSTEPLLKVDVVSGVEGLSLYFDGNRVDGPKPWDGGRILHTFTVLVNDLDRVTVLSKALAEAREQGAREERERLRAAITSVRRAPTDAWEDGSESALGWALALLDEPTDAP